MLHLCKTASIEGVMQVRGLRASEVSRPAGNALFPCILGRIAATVKSEPQFQRAIAGFHQFIPMSISISSSSIELLIAEND